MAIVPDEDAGMLLISKLYVLTAKRGRGFGRKRLEFAGYAVQSLQRNRARAK
jgi:hypothetical protein